MDGWSTQRPPNFVPILPSDVPRGMIVTDGEIWRYMLPSVSDTAWAMLSKTERDRSREGVVFCYLGLPPVYLLS